MNASTVPPTADSKHARIYCLIARDVRRAIIFRRGPTNQVRLLVWDLKRDTIRAGQWLKARIYERRCDVSPDGEHLVYFAATYRKPLRSWTAISRPPYFTALALWPKGDGWGGGGLFDRDLGLSLNHRANEFKMGGRDASKLPARFRVQQLGTGSGWGEDDPIMTMRLERDGWTMIGARERGTRNDFRTAKVWVTFDPPLTRHKTMRLKQRGKLLTLRTRCHGIKERQGRWYVETSDVIDGSGATIFDCGRTDWADLDHNGDVLFARAGRLYRLAKHALRGTVKDDAAQLVADLNDMRFEAVTPPASALRWK
jgi:hypothetical protein